MTASIISDGSNQLSTSGALPQGWLVECVIEGRMAWLVEPVPLEPYTFTFELEKAHVFGRFENARDTGSSVWCGLDSRGMPNPPISVVKFNEEYRAQIASELS